MIFLETRDVVKQFTGHLALNKVSISAPQGKIFGLLGPNGAGKTTLIRIINRITAPDSGEVLIEGKLSQPSDIYRIGYLPEERGLYKKMKTGEQAVYLAQLKGLKAGEAKRRLMQWFEKFDIMNWWNKKVEELSKGMQQKVQFIVTVVHNPDLLIFDEPFSGFDPVNTELLKQEILNLKEQGKTIIFSTHNMASVEEICDEIALINKSEVVLSGNVSEVRSRFRSGTYNIGILDENLTDIPDYYTVISNSPSQNGVYNFRINKQPSVGNSELLRALAQNHEIVAFTEELPSMNDVFLKVVS
ncbi:MAG: ATP-binding cassette domain-containing protein [Tannerella sp.]|jgi:ABC-2 type transport system ATP-binding protein|nr:ATP-binding cassette domain-containing protein [Tannerella sp.]